MTVVVSGIGLVSSLGNRRSTWQRVLAGESGLRLIQPFAELPSRPLGLWRSQPSVLEAALVEGIQEAVEDAGLALPLRSLGVVIGSSRSYQGAWEQFAEAFQRRSHAPGGAAWLASLPQSVAIAAARQVDSQGPVLSPMAACATGAWAIAQGMMLIESGQCEQVLAGAIDMPITPLTLTGFQRMGALATETSRPFDRDRDGLALGEGAAFLVLERAAIARQRGARIYGRVLGAGLTADAHHVSAPDPHRAGAKAAVEQCLRRSGLTSAAIHYIHAHGTGTRLNDQQEADLIQTLFPFGPAVSSTKGATGHTLGASGALGAAFCLLALGHQELPPCTGLQTPNFDLNLVRTRQPATGEYCLSFSFGFGGQNAVLAFGAGD